VNSALFPYHGKIYHLLCNPRLFKKVRAQFIGPPLLSLRVCRSQPKQSREGYEIATHLAGARNDSGKQPDESNNYKNLEVKYEDS
jgi:hypothetical protein